MSFTIDRFQESDKQDWLELRNMADSWSQDNNRPDIPEANWAGIMNENAVLEGVALRADDKLVGYALYFFCPDVKESRDACELRDLFILPDYRRQGGGTALVKAVGEKAKQGNAGRLYWAVNALRDDTVAFYRTFSAEEWSHKTFHQWLNIAGEKAA